MNDSQTPLTALTSPENERAADACHQTAEAAQAAIAWMEANAERVGPDGVALLADLRSLDVPALLRVIRSACKTGGPSPPA